MREFPESCEGHQAVPWGHRRVEAGPPGPWQARPRPPLACSPLQSQHQAPSWASLSYFSGQPGLDSGLFSPWARVCAVE